MAVRVKDRFLYQHATPRPSADGFDELRATEPNHSKGACWCGSLLVNYVFAGVEG